MNRNTSPSLPLSRAGRDRERRVFRFLRRARVPDLGRRMPRPLPATIHRGWRESHRRACAARGPRFV